MERDTCGNKKVIINDRQRKKFRTKLLHNNDQITLSFQKNKTKRLWKNHKENKGFHAAVCEVIPEMLFEPVLLVGVGTLNATVAFQVLNVNKCVW